jgi:hypothetical protein
MDTARSVSDFVETETGAMGKLNIAGSATDRFRRSNDTGETLFSSHHMVSGDGLGAIARFGP